MGCELPYYEESNIYYVNAGNSFLNILTKAQGKKKIYFSYLFIRFE